MEIRKPSQMNETAYENLIKESLFHHDGGLKGLPVNSNHVQP